MDIWYELLYSYQPERMNDIEFFLEKIDEQLYFILTLLEKNPKGLSVERLEKECNRTRKTILSYINELKELLNEYTDIGIYMNKNHIIMFRKNESDFHDVYCTLYKRSSKIIILNNFFLEDTFSIKKIATLQNYSYSKLWKAYQKLKIELINFGVALNRTEYFTGEEEKIRILAYHFFWSLNKGRTWTFSKTNYIELMKIVEKIIALFGCPTSTIQKEKMAYIIAISNERILLDKHLSKSTNNIFLLVDLEDQLFMEFKQIIENRFFLFIGKNEELNYLYQFISIEFPELEIIKTKKIIDLWEIKNSRMIELLRNSPSFCKLYFYHKVLNGNFYHFLITMPSYFKFEVHNESLSIKEEIFIESIYSYYKNNKGITIYFDTDFGQELENKVCNNLSFFLMSNVKRVDSLDDLEVIDFFITTNIDKIRNRLPSYFLHGFPSKQQIEKIGLIIENNIRNQFKLYINELDIV